LKPVLVATAGPTTVPPATQAVLVQADMVRAFLRENEVTAAGASSDVKAALVRVICVRK
jgi:hypothetical protein